MLALPAPDEQLVLVRAMYHYARAIGPRTEEGRRGRASRDRRDRRASMPRPTSSPSSAWGVPAKEIMADRAARRHRAARRRGGRPRARRRGLRGGDRRSRTRSSYTEPPYWYYPVRQSLGAVRLRQGRLDDAEQRLPRIARRVRNNGWALAGLAEVYKRKGDRNGEAAAQRAYAKAWFGSAGGPDLARL